jgi:formylglycine-generating enzyme required for sulfatase activity
VSGFRLDAYEVTVGRFRQFVSAVVGGWTPPAGSGKHAHLNAGAGVNGGTETGWDVSWNTYLASSEMAWTNNLIPCDIDFGGSGQFGTWTPSAGMNESLPITCITWYEAEAFCIWDGGFLPTEAEWNYAASGGTEQRKYPWGAGEPIGTISDLANFDRAPCTGVVDIDPVGSLPHGDGRWGQSDLAGNVWEWTLDMYADPLPTPCNDCASVAGIPDPVIRGASFVENFYDSFAPTRLPAPPARRVGNNGARCARTP